MSSRDSRGRSSRRRIPIRRPDQDGEGDDQQPDTQPSDASSDVDQSSPDEQQDTVPARVVEVFERELVDAKRERDEWEEKYKRAHAEMQNMRRRLTRNAEREAFAEQRRTLKRMLEIADNLERAIAAAGESETELAQGVRLTYQELLRAFRDLGVEQMDTEGESFDPAYHEAVNVVSRPEVPDETIVREEQKGYTYRDEVLRPAKVWVAK